MERTTNEKTVPTEWDKVVYDISVSQRLISEDQARMAVQQLDSLEQQGRRTTLSLLLEQSGLISPIQRQSLENAAQYRVFRDVDKDIAQLLEQHRYLERSVINEALAAQKNHYRTTGWTVRIGDWLVENEYLDPAQTRAVEKLYELKSKQSPSHSQHHGSSQSHSSYSNSRHSNSRHTN